MVEGLNGSIKWLFNHSTICLFSDKIRCKAINSAGHQMQGMRPVNPSVKYCEKREDTVEKLFMEVNFGFCSDCGDHYLCFADI